MSGGRARDVSGVVLSHDGGLREYGMADLVKGGSSKVFRKDAESERVLNLSVNIRRWLAAEGKKIPEGPQRKRRKKAE